MDIAASVNQEYKRQIIINLSLNYLAVANYYLLLIYTFLG